MSVVHDLIFAATLTVLFDLIISPHFYLLSLVDTCFSTGPLAVFNFPFGLILF